MEPDVQRRLMPGEIVEEFGPEHTRQMELEKIRQQAPLVVNWIERAFNAGYMSGKFNEPIEEAFKKFCNDNC